jgi:hypothetical protein
MIYSKKFKKSKCSLPVIKLFNFLASKFPRFSGEIKFSTDFFSQINPAIMLNVFILY